MGLGMLHFNEVNEAIRLACQGAALLKADTDGSALVRVGSNELFPVDSTVELVDEESAAEEHVVRERVGLTQIRLDRAVAGEFMVSRGARVRLKPAPFPEVRWIAQGRPARLPEPLRAQMPCIVVECGAMEQPLGEGTNRVYNQHYGMRVHYVRPGGEGETDEEAALEDAARLFDLLMQDMYLGGTCWHAQVTRVDPHPREEDELRARGVEARVVTLEVEARRAEVWRKGG